MKQLITKTLFLLLLSTSLTLTACSPAQASPTTTPTQISVEAIHTQAAATIYAGQTGTASAMPTSTPTATNTLTPTATITNTPTLTKVAYVAPFFTAVITTTGTPGTLMPSPTATLGGVGCNNSAFIQDMSIPDNSNLNPDKTFTKTWRIKNTGTCTWTSDFKFTFVGGELFNSDTTKIRRTVGPGAMTDISLAMVAPGSPGTYSSYWRMADDKGDLFGTVFNILIIVPGSTFTPAPTETETPVPPTAYP